MKILLTGATGFIGAHFTRYTASQDIIPFSFHNSNIDTLNLSGIDTVLHLAALVHQMNGAPSEAYEQINVTRTLDLAKKAKAAGVKQFVFMSTVKVYGEETNTVYSETTPCHPQDDYGRSKLHAEQELQKLGDKNFMVSIIRTPIVYGAGVKANIKSLITLIQKMPILPFGNTENQRSMVYIGNLCALITHIIEHQKGGIFLANDDTALSTSDFIRTIGRALGKKLYLIHIPLFEYLLKFIKPSFHQRLFGNLLIDNTLTKEQLGFRNPYSTEEGIKNMIQGEHYDI
ncbi:MAG: NAD-dependent epimerase/dehydratase family protein [Sulfuricurvum sp.]|uniref:NAD-dependent epimerase/dehydratase family protein n=1 Tax=Sulfuricurvum sp. TaxID=2025608 RepID=UPI0025F94F2E|nr:NAD-dependent epimerase/dehydratase family protein [Sulfuricurvum sp.]MBV5321115.1 NAD-dependent epimerase/dehydratase family protein [Sulfuricurvum sp.]